MKRAETRVHRQTRTTRSVSGFRAAVSLHSHTLHSKESLEFLPHYVNFHSIPFLTRLIRSELNSYRDRAGKTVDFCRAYWTPPVTPAMVLASETSQIEQKLGLRAVVSITDHDTIAGVLSLQGLPTEVPTLISVEWTIPFAGNAFHIGAHNLEPNNAVEIMKELSCYTFTPNPAVLGDLLSLIASYPETLLVLNHPGCNFVRVGAAQHWASLQQFLTLCRPWIHALELNGMRPWGENRDILRLAEEYDLPLVAGGDRHGCRPNTMVNLSQGDAWKDFVTQIRDDRCNDVLVLPAYEEPVRLRELATAGDVLRRYPDYPYGLRRFTDRIFVDVEGYSWHSLSFYWDGGNGKPRWLEPIVAAVIALGSDAIRPLIRRLLLLRGEYDDTAHIPRADYGSEALRGPKARSQ